MKKLALASLLCIVVVSCLLAQINEKLKLELLQMFQEDQKARQEFINSGMKSKELDAKIVEIDTRNTNRIKEIIKEYGWPTKSLVGEDGMFVAFTLVQHADLNPSLQNEVLVLMKELELKNPNEVFLPGIAFLTDRTRMARKEKQLYGTQVMLNTQTKEVIIYPIEDPDNLHERRKKYGLIPMNEYLEQIKKAYGIIK